MSGDNGCVLAAVAFEARDGQAQLTRYGDDGTLLAPPETLELDRLARVSAPIETEYRPRWIFDDAVEAYGWLFAEGLRVRSCHDIALVERILLGRAGRFGEPCRAKAVLARAAGASPPDDPPPMTALRGAAPEQPRLFGEESGGAAGTASCAELVTAYLDQLGRIEDAATGSGPTAAGIAVPVGALRLLLAAESGSALVAAEMTGRGLPWDAVVHREILADVLGPEPRDGQRPARLAELAAEIGAAFGFPVNPDSPVELKEAFRRSGFELESTRAWVLREIDHPAIAPLLDYKDRARLYSANGWHWLADWISPDGRLAAQFLPGAVVSGRWATRGGGGLQLPASLRRAAVAHDGHVLVVADAAQLEPRILAAVSKDPALTELSTGPDLYAALAADGFGGDRRHAKLAMLGAMYGQTSGEAARLMATMRVRYPAAVHHVEAGALRGETGAVVQSVLGRACPPPSDAWRRLVGAGSDSARRVARDRGRFTRNFVIQASAADWAAVWMTTLRLALMDEVPDAELVLFQHDELVVHTPAATADRVSELVVDAARRARDLVFPGSAVALPVRPSAVRSYADAK
jgi:DNA polymerase I